MLVCTSRKELDTALLDKNPKNAVGLVPTMGALHQGHASLVKKSVSQNDITVVSIFVNPTQFDNPQDLKKYPRTLEKDIQLLEKVSSKIIVFSPNAEDLYKGKVASRKFNFGPLEHEMEGKHRKGHFDGVGTVVSLLLKAVNPHRAYFGEKDFQQLQIVKRLVEIEDISATIIGCPIVRESNGLAMSSRNKRLSKKQKEEATIISKTLKEAKENFDSLSIPKLEALAKKRFKDNPHLALEYFEIANTKTLKTAQRKRKDNTYRAFVAAFAGEIRLIDNMALN